MENLARLDVFVEWEPSQVYCHYPPFYYANLRPLGKLLEKVVVEASGDVMEVTWEVTPTVEASAISSVKTAMTRMVPKLKISQTAHDLCSEVFSGMWGTDKCLQDVLGPADDGLGRLTPDHISILPDGRVWVMEMATFGGPPSPRAYQDVVNEKRMKYMEAIQNRLGDRPCVFLIVVVGHNHLASTVELPEQLQTELSIRYRIGRQVEAKAASMGLDFRLADSKLEKEVTLLKQSLSKVTLPPSSYPEKTASYTDLSWLNQDWAERVRQSHPSPEFFLTSLSNIMEAAAKDRKPPIKCIEEWDAAVVGFVKNRSCDGLRSDKKTIIQFPFAVARKSPGAHVPTTYWADTADSCASEKLWVHCLSERVSCESWFEEEHEVLLEEALSPCTRDADSYLEKRKSLKRTWHRVSTRFLDPRVKRDLALQGVCAKKLKSDEDIKSKREESQRPFSIFTPCDDVKSVLDHDLGVSPVLGSDELKAATELLKKSEVFQGNNPDGLDSITDLMNTTTFMALYQMSCAATEVAISRKQNVKSDEWILKKIPGWDIYILIHPTRGGSHVFFTLWFPDGVYIPFSGAVFRNLIPCEGGYITEVVSVNSSKLENLILAPYIWLTSVVHWGIQGGIPRLDLTWAVVNDNREVRDMAMLSVLVGLDDRSRTEETITQVRYMMMELFKGPDPLSYPEPSKILSKLPELLRSRLQVYLTNQILENVGCMVKNPPVLRQMEELEKNEDLSGDVWDHLYNPLTGNNVVSAKYIIEVFYLGYIKNKNEESSDNTSFQLIKKIISRGVDLKMDDCKKFFCIEDTPLGEMKPHFVSPTFILSSCDLIRSQLEDILGAEWQETLSQEIYQSWIRECSWESFATFKASGAMDPYDKDAKKSPAHPGRKCIEEVADAISEAKAINPLFDLPRLVEEVKRDWGGVACYIFKKAQHGGLREIYVLTMQSKVIQKFIETAMRAICKYFPEETLCTPSSKSVLINQHYANVSSSAIKNQGRIMSRVSSEDKSTWNQGFIVTTFMVAVVRILPREVSEPIAVCIKLWLTKVIMLPAAIQKLLLKRIKLDDPTFKKLYDGFWGEESDLTDVESDMFTNEGEAYIKILAGMWQGILHVTSSLIHLLKCQMLKAIVKRIIPVIQMAGGLDLVATTLCSSDDSLTLVSAVIPDDSSPTTKFSIDCLLDLIVKSEAHLSKFFQMTASPKCVNGRYVYEFNSNFFLRGGLLNPLVKFSFASLSLTESSTFSKRQEIAYNLMKDMIEAGATHTHVYMQQIIQGFVHYHCLGMTSNPLFLEWAKALKASPSIHCGFFCLDTDIVSGLMGSGYCHWRNMAEAQAPLSFTTAKVVKSSTQDLDVADFQQSIALYYGDAKRWKRLVSRVTDKGVVESFSEVDRLRILMQQRAETVDELKVLLDSKARSSGAYESLRGRGNVVTMAGTGVYSLNTHCITKGEIRLAVGQEAVDTPLQLLQEKVSLLKVTRDTATLSQTLPQEHLYSKEATPEMLMVFPRLIIYKQVWNMICKIRRTGYLEQRTYAYRKKRNVIRLTSFDSQFVCKPLDSLKRIWFDMEVKAPRGNVEKTFLQLSAMFPWLKRTPEETLQGPLRTPEGLVQFFKSFDDKTSTICPVSRRITSQRPLSQILSCIQFNYYPSIELVPRMVVDDDQPSKYLPGDIITDNMVQVNELMDRIDLILLMPVPDELKRTLIVELIEANSHLSVDLSLCSGLSRKELFLQLAIGLIQKTIPPELIPKHMLLLKGGHYVEWVLRQKKKATGYGKLRIHFPGSHVEVHVHNNLCFSLIADSVATVRMNSFVIGQVLKRLSYVSHWSTAIVPGKSKTAMRRMFTGSLIFTGRSFISSSVVMETKETRDLCARIYTSSLVRGNPQPEVAPDEVVIRVSNYTVSIATVEQGQVFDRLVHSTTQNAHISQQGEIDLTPVMDISEFVSSWISCQPIPSNLIVMLIGYLYINRENLEEDVNMEGDPLGLNGQQSIGEVLTWFRFLLKCRLIKMSILPSLVSFSTLEADALAAYNPVELPEFPPEFFQLTPMTGAEELLGIVRVPERPLDIETQPIPALFSFRPGGTSAAHPTPPVFSSISTAKTSSSLAPKERSPWKCYAGLAEIFKDAAEEEGPEDDEAHNAILQLTTKWVDSVTESLGHTRESLREVYGQMGTDDGTSLEVPDAPVSDSVYFRHNLLDAFIKEMSTLGLWRVMFGPQSLEEGRQSTYRVMCWFLEIEESKIPMEDPFASTVGK